MAPQVVLTDDLYASFLHGINPVKVDRIQVRDDF